MKQTPRILSVLIAVALLFGCFPYSASAMGLEVEESELPDVQIGSGQTEQESAGDGSTAERPLQIPDEALVWEYDGTTLKGIEETWFQKNVTAKNIQYISVHIPSKTDSLPDDIFYSNAHRSQYGYNSNGEYVSSVGGGSVAKVLARVDFSDATQLKTIGRQAFHGCKNLGGVFDMSATALTEIGGNLLGNTAVEAVVFPETLERLGSERNMPTFSSCTNLRYVGTQPPVGDEIVFVLPPNIKFIGKQAFDLSKKSPLYQKMMTEPMVITIPASVETILTSAFCGPNFYILENEGIFSSIDKQAFNYQKNRPGRTDVGTILLSSYTAYQSLDPTGLEAMKAYTNLTFQVNLRFLKNGTECASQTKLFGADMEYCLSEGTWCRDPSYELPVPENTEGKSEGYYGGWMLDGHELGARRDNHDLNKVWKVLSSSPADTLDVIWKDDFVEPPVISYSVNGTVVPHADENTPLPVPCNGTVGIQLTHPLIKTEATDIDHDTYVDFEYLWLDIENLDEGARSNEDGQKWFWSQTKQENGWPNMDTNSAVPLTEDNEIPMRSAADNRIGEKNYYLVKIYGKYIENGTSSHGYYFQTPTTFISFGGPHTIDQNITTTEAVILRAVVEEEPTEHTVTFDPQGGTAVPSEKVMVGEHLTVPAAPTRTGYTFKGWYKEAECRNIWDFETEAMPDSDLTLYAGWKKTPAPPAPKYYILEYVSNGGTSYESESYMAGKQILLDKQPQKEDHEFTGWYLDSELKNKVTQVTLSENTRVYAGWQQVRFVVKFDSQGGTAVPSEKVMVGEHLTVPAAPTRTGYTFKGWYKEAECRNIWNFETEAMPASDVILYGKWDKNTGASGVTYYTLRYESNGGTEFPLESYRRGAHVKLEKIPTREGYRFTGWYREAGIKIQLTDITITHNTIVYAGWEKVDCSGLLNREDHLAYMIGYGNGYWGPDNHLCRNETAAIFSRLLKEHLLPATIRPGKWRDVPRASWFYEATCILNDLGIMCGRSDVIFAPEAPITRAEFATVCARFDDREITVLQVFDDIEGHWAEKNIRRAASLGWIKGFPDGMFHPDEYITRAQAAAIINRMLNRTPQSVQDMCHGQLKRWEDVSEKAWYYIDVQEAAHGHTHRKTSDGHEQWIKIIQK